MLGETWKDQHERLKRSHALVQQVGGRTLLPQDRDNAYHFCCDALHLRDWIAAAMAKPSFTTHMLPKQKQNIIEGINDQITAELFTPSRELSACEDIATARST